MDRPPGTSPASSGHPPGGGGGGAGYHHLPRGNGLGTSKMSYTIKEGTADEEAGALDFLFEDIKLENLGPAPEGPPATTPSSSSSRGHLDACPPSMQRRHSDQQEKGRHSGGLSAQSSLPSGDSQSGGGEKQSPQAQTQTQAQGHGQGLQASHGGGRGIGDRGTETRSSWRSRGISRPKSLDTSNSAPLFTPSHQHTQLPKAHMHGMMGSPVSLSEMNVVVQTSILLQGAHTHKT